MDLGPINVDQLINLFIGDGKRKKKIHDRNERGPVFKREGNYAKAFKRNERYATPGPYQTTLTAPQEIQFRQWARTNNVPFDVHAKHVDYDMRRYWLLTMGVPSLSPPGGHFPDTFKTPYDTTFSNESIYATPDNPLKWKKRGLINTLTNRWISK